MALKHWAKLLIVSAVSMVVVLFLVRQFAPANVQAYFRV